jgi:hypothetical protein
LDAADLKEKFDLGSTVQAAQLIVRAITVELKDQR